MKIGIVGLGFVGLSFVSVLGSKGYDVVGIDNNKKKIMMINEGKSPFFEPRLENTLKVALKKKAKFYTSINELTNNCDLIFVTVGTPQSKKGNIDLSMIKLVSNELSTVIKKSSNKPIIIIKSTVTPETTNKVIKPILEKKSGKKVDRDFGLITNPEFLRESQAIYDTSYPHAVILGGNQNRFMKKLTKFYKTFHGETPIIQTNLQTAEMIKYANNSFLATKISYINQIAKICEKIPGTNIDDISRTIGLDPRIGELFLNAGPGYGGSCLPKDVKAIINFSSKLGIKPSLLDAVDKINREQVNHIVKLIEKNCGKIKNKKITILGLSFKPKTDDVRDSVSLELIKELLKKDVNVTVHDPKAINNVKEIFKNKINYENSISNAIKNSFCMVIMTAWPEYKKISNNEIKLMKKAIIIDSQRILLNKKINFNYHAIGIGD